jgi:hypothetical protein
MRNLLLAACLVAMLSSCDSRDDAGTAASSRTSPEPTGSTADVCTQVAGAISEQYALEPGAGSATSCELGSPDGSSTIEITLDEADEADALASVREECRAWDARVENDRCMTDVAGSEGPVRYASYLRTVGSVLTITADVADGDLRSLLPAELASIESALS